MDETKIDGAYGFLGKDKEVLANVYVVRITSDEVEFKLINENN